MVMAVSLVSSGRRAVVSSVSTTCSRRRAVVSSVSRGQCECVVMASNILISSSCRAGREKVRPAALFQHESAKKFALRAQNTPNSVFLCLRGEFFRGSAVVGAVLGELFRANRHCARSCRRCGALQAGSGGGFALHEAVVQRVAGVSDPRVVQFPRCSVPHPVLCAHRVSLVC